MYEKMYYRLFNSVTDALLAMNSRNYGIAEEIMKKAQCDAEEMYISWEGGDGEVPASGEC